MDEVTIGKARLIHGDCLQFMRGLEDNAFELACVDVPYGIGMDGNSNWSGSKHKIKEWDIEPPSIEYFNELQRISKNQIIWGANHFIDKIAKPSPCWIIWDKKNDGFSFADAELAWTSFKTAIRFFRYHRGQQTDTRIHPTQKPISLYEFCLSNYAKQGDKILDTHLGSMSSVIAALNLGFEITGTELDDDYFKSGVARVRQSQQQVRMFEPEIVSPKQDVLI